MRKKSIYRWISISVAILVSAVFIAPALLMAAEGPVTLGTTVNFAVLAGTTVTNTGPTRISGSAGGDVGVSPGTSVTGFPPGKLTGTIHRNDAVAIQAQIDLVTAYNDAASRPVTENLTGQDLGGLTLTAGVYKFDTSAQLTGTLTLDAEGDPNAVFIFQIGSTLTTASNSSVSLINGAQSCHVYWQVGSSATLGTNTNFVGRIFAWTSITANTGATIQGQLLAHTGAVTLDSNVITNDLCVVVTPTPPEETTTEGTTAEETTTEGTTAEETTTEGTTAEETTVEETTTEGTTAEETTVEETTTEGTTAEETTAEETTVEETTTEMTTAEETTVEETTVEMTTVEETTVEMTTAEETTVEETTVEMTTVEMTTAEETTVEETTVEESTVEMTTVEMTTAEETTVEETETTTERTTAEETTSEETTIETIPLVETEEITKATAITTTQESQSLTEDEIPRTGSSGDSAIIGTTLLALAASLFYILRRKRELT